MQNKIILATKKLTKSHIIFSNHTSQSDCIDYQKINFLFANDNEITITVPKKTCASGHNLSLYIFDNDKQLRNLKSMPQDKSILKCWIINGVINQSDDFDEETIEITVSLNDKLNETWNNFVNEINQKQEKVSEIFNKMRK